MRLAVAAAGAEAHETLFCDDSLRNIAGGRALGLHTVLVRRAFFWGLKNFSLSSSNFCGS